MKAEERKELKQNTLVATLEKVGHGLKQGPSRRTVVILGILLLIGVVIGVYLIITNVNANRNSDRWKPYITAVNPDELGTLISKNSDTVQGRAARLQKARQDLSIGLGDGTGEEGGILSDYKNGKERLTSAAESFEKLAREYRTTPVLVQECYYGAAQAREALGEFEQAAGLYDKVSETAKASPLATQAEQAARRVRDKQVELEKVQEQLKKS